MTPVCISMSVYILQGSCGGGPVKMDLKLKKNKEAGSSSSWVTLHEPRELRDWNLSPTINSHIRFLAATCVLSSMSWEHGPAQVAGPRSSIATYRNA